MKRSPFSSARREGFSLLEMTVSLVILGLLLLIFIRLDFLVQDQNRRIATRSGEWGQTWSVMLFIMHDVHEARQVHALGLHGVALKQVDRNVTWRFANGRAIRKIDGRKMLSLPSRSLTFSLNGDGTVTVEPEGSSLPPLTVVMEGI